MLTSLFNQLLFLETIGDYVRFVIAVFTAMIKKLPRLELIRDQLYSMGVMSISVVSLTGLCTGMVLAAQSYYQLYDKGLAGITGLMVAKAMFTELGPVLTGFMVVGRVGASMTAELGTMQVTEQIDAMKSMAVDPNRYLVAPRFLSGFFMFPLLTVYSVAVGIFGGYLISVYFLGMAPVTYWDPIPQYMTHFDFVLGSVKAFIFSFLITTISCYKGMTVSGGAAGVGQSTTTSVVACYVLLLILNFFLTLSLNILHKAFGWWT